MPKKNPEKKSKNKTDLEIYAPKLNAFEGNI